MPDQRTNGRACIRCVVEYSLAPYVIECRRTKRKSKDARPDDVQVRHANRSLKGRLGRLAELHSDHSHVGKLPSDTLSEAPDSATRLQYLACDRGIVGPAEITAEIRQFRFLG